MRHPPLDWIGGRAVWDATRDLQAVADFLGARYDYVRVRARALGWPDLDEPDMMPDARGVTPLPVGGTARVRCGRCCAQTEATFGALSAGTVRCGKCGTAIGRAA